MGPFLAAGFVRRCSSRSTSFVLARTERGLRALHVDRSYAPGVVGSGRGTASCAQTQRPGA